jgi:hypothetical protein
MKKKKKKTAKSAKSAGFRLAQAKKIPNPKTHTKPNKPKITKKPN